MHSFLSDFFSQSPQLGINPLLSAPPAVPHSSSLLRVATGGVGAVTPFEAPPTETPGKVLPMTQVDHPPPIISVHNVSLVRGVVSSRGSPYPGLGHSVRSNVMDQLRVTSVTCESSFPPLSALSPSSFLYPLSDSGFVSLYSYATSLSSCSSVAFLSSASSSVYASSFTPLSSSTSFSLPPLSYPPRPSVLSPAPRVTTPPPPGFPPLPPVFPPLSSSSSCAAPSFSSSFPLSLSASSGSSPSLLTVVSFVSSAPVSSLSSSAPFSSSSSSHASSSLDYASFKAHVLGISDEYLSLARWYHSVDGSDFFSFLSSLFSLSSSCG